MPDEPIEVTALHFTKHESFTVEAWPQWTAVTEEYLRSAHLHHATVEGDVLHYRIGNGEARYRLHRDRPYGQGFLAELVEGTEPKSLKARAKKYAIRTDDD
jgi:hypothetical protein